VKTGQKRNESLDGVVRGLRALFAAESAEQLADHELIERFVNHRDESAFSALVLRHGSMALGVCQRVLQNAHDAEDACQAAFLVLARKAGSVRKKDSLSSWLHGVAYRVASNLKKKIARRRAHEGKLLGEPPATREEVSWRDVKAVLDEELQRLPEHFRVPLLLCYLEGKTRDEAAQDLGWSVATLRGRLERGRLLLGNRLARRGVTLTASLLAVLLGQHAALAGLPATLVVETVRAVMSNAAGHVTAGVVSTHVAALADGVLKSMWIPKLKTAMVLVFLVVLTGAGVGVVCLRTLVAEPRGNAAEAFARDAKELNRLAGQINDAQDDFKQPPLKDNQAEERHEPAQKKNNDHPPAKVNHGKQFHGMLKSTNIVDKMISVTVKEHGHDMTRAYSLAEDAKVLAGGKDGQISDLRPGMVVNMVLSTDEKTVVAIKILHE
jgi:RNA polymerase sigma factor (sigma-70 family)